MSTRGCAVAAVLAFAGIVVVGLMLPPGDVIQAGDVRVLGDKPTWVATTGDDFDAMLDAQNAADRGGPGSRAMLFRLAESGRIQLCPAGAEVVVMETGFASARIEVTKGEYKGRGGWVQKELIHKPN